MVSQGPNYPATRTTQSVLPEDDNDWLTVTNIGADDGAEAQITAATYDANDISFQLKAQGFGFNLPAGSTIDGIVVEIDRRAFAGAAEDYRVQLLDAAGALVGDDKQTATAWPGTSAVATYGSSSDTWTASPTEAMVEDPDFGVVLSVLATAANTDIGVDYIRMTVYYTAPAPSMNAEPGSYAVNGGVATALQWGHILNAEPATFLVSGAAAATLVGYLLSADPDAYLITGVDATLVYEATGLGINAEPGTYLIVGSNAEVLVGRLLVAEAGAYTLIGFDATLAAGVPGAFTSYGREFLYTAANWAVADIALEVYMRATSGTVRARLYDVTADTFVSGTVLITTSSSFTRVRGANLKSSLIDGHLYRVQFGKEDPDTGEFLAAQLVAF